MRKILWMAALAVTVYSATSCHNLGTWQAQEKQQISLYIKSLGDTVYSLKPSGLYYIELKTGTGRMPANKDTVLFRYAGMFLDRVSFDNNLSTATPYTAVLGNNEIIPGLDEGIRYMKEGGKSRFVLPSSLAYGQAGIWGTIPGYTPLLFEVQLLSVHPAGSSR